MEAKEIGAALALLKGKAIEQVPAAVENWLDNNPDATTTVQDGAITKAKLHNDLAEEIEGNTEDVSALKNALQDTEEAIGFEKQTLLVNKSIDNYNATVLPENIKNENGFCCLCVDCEAGDKFTIAGTGGNTTRLWAFSNSSGTILDVSDKAITRTDLVVTAPANAAYFAFNSRTSSSTIYVYKGVKPKDEIDSLKTLTASHTESIEQISENLGAVDDRVEALENAEVPYLAERTDMATLNKSGTGSQMVDISQYTLYNYGTVYKYYGGVRFQFEENGKYYINPLGQCSLSEVKAYDSEDNQVYSNTFNLQDWSTLERVSNTKAIIRNYTTRERFYAGNVYNSSVIEFTGDVAYLVANKLVTQGFNGTTNIGITFERPTVVYMPYGTNLCYNEEMADAVWESYVNNNKFYDVPEKRLNPWMQRSYAVSENLVDDRMFDWTKTSGNYTLKNDCYIPVIGGKTIISNKRMLNLKSYDSEGTETIIGLVGRGQPVTLGQDAVAIRFDVGIGDGKDKIPSGEYYPIVVKYTDEGYLYPQDMVDMLPTPRGQINGWDISKNLYDYTIPDEKSGIARMIKAFAIRELNHQRNAIRVGTFNVYNIYNLTNPPIVKKELETYGIDMCCFQESRLRLDGYRINLGDYLRGWQFSYCNTNEEDVDAARAMASRYKIVSSEAFTFTENPNSSFLKCVIELPRYKDCLDGDTTLSLYTYHGNVSSSATRIAEVTQLLSKIAEDTSDFVVVTGDTNDFSTNKEIWAMFENAGLTPAHNGFSKTVTADNDESIDNIFFSEHITCLYYDVVNSNEWSYDGHPVSDHDFLYADLQFDFEAVIEAKRENS